MVTFRNKRSFSDIPEYNFCYKFVKTSEDGKVDGINFTITGNGINQTVTTANGGKFQIDNLMPGIYTVTEQTFARTTQFTERSSKHFQIQKAKL